MGTIMEDFDKNVYYGYLIKGDLAGAIGYVKQFPGQAGGKDWQPF